jgi:hypothetical protein
MLAPRLLICHADTTGISTTSMGVSQCAERAPLADDRFHAWEATDGAIGKVTADSLAPMTPRGG